MAETNTNDGIDNDALVDASDSTKAKVANAEQEMLLQYVLGLDLRDVSRANAEPNALVIANKVLASIAGRIDATRTSIDQNGLRGVLDQNISSALRGVTQHADPSRNNADQLGLRRIRAIAEGIYASIPKNLIDEMMRFSMPVALQVDTTLNRHKLFLGTVKSDINGGLDPTGDEVVIDTRHVFWIENGPFEDANAFAEALKGKKFTACGIELSRTGANPSAVITEPLAKAIAGADLNVIQLSNKYQTRLERIEIGAQQRDCSIDMNLLVSTEMDGGRPHRYVGECTVAELTTWLENQQNFRRVTGGLDGVDLFSNGTFPGVGTMRLPQLIAYIAFFRIKGNVTFAPTDSLAVETVDVLRVQKELQEQHQYHRKLREGSDNSAGAAMAASILMRYKDIGGVLGGGDGKEEKEKLDKLNAKIGLNALLEKVKQANVTAENAWDVNQQIIRDIPANLAQCTQGVPINITIAGKTFAVTSATKDQAANAAQWVREREREAKEEIAQYKKIESTMRSIATAVARIKDKNIAPPAILGFFAIPATKPYTAVGSNAAEFERDKINGALAEIEGDTDMAVSDADKEEKTKLDQQLSDIKSGKNKGLQGAAAQHAVIAKYFESYHNCTVDEAKKAANYVLARTKIDAEVTSAVRELSDEQFRDDRTYLESVASNVSTLWNHGSFSEGHATNVITGIANAIRIPMAGGRPNWARARNHRDLATAYHALRKLRTDDGVPAHLKLKDTTFLQREMREITKQLLTKKHVVNLLMEQGMTKADATEAAKDSTRADVIEKVRGFLESDIPTAYQSRVKAAIDHAEKRVEWKRRKLNWTTKKVAGGAWWAGKKTVGGAYGATKWTAGKGFGAVKAVTYTAPKAVVMGALNNKITIAATAIGAVTAGPLGAVALGYMAKKMFETAPPSTAA